ncbi:MAG: DNA polymerase [Patescibacteria group bacterium]
MKTHTIIDNQDEAGKFLSSFDNTKMIVIYPLLITGKLLIGFFDKIHFGVVDYNRCKKETQQFIHDYQGIAVFDRAKEAYKLFFKNQLNFPQKPVDLEVGAYLEDSTRKPDIVKIIEKKYLVSLQVEQVKAIDSTSNEDIFGDLETTPEIDLLELEKNCKHYLVLAEEYLGSFTPELTKLWLEIESPLTAVLAKMELKGVFINKKKLSDIAVDLTNKSKLLESEITDYLKVDNLNLNSSQQLVEALQGVGFALTKKSSSGKLSLDKYVLEGLVEKDDSGVIKKILKYRILTKLLSTYTANLIEQLDVNDRLHCNFDQTQAATGRLSSNSPNLQNIPIRNNDYGLVIRSCFTAPKGKLLVRADYSQIELRLLAHFTGDPVLKEAFELGQDIHSRTAAEIFEIPLSEVTKKQRSLGKTLNFALLYQQGAFATARQLEISVKEARAFIEKYFATFATVKPFIEQVLAKAKVQGYSESICSRRRYFKYLNSTNKMLVKEDERAAFNMVLQGSNADLIKIAMNQIDKQIKEQKLQANMILQVHDELVFEVEEKDSTTITELVQKTMTNPPIELSVPLVVDIGTGSNWAEC